MFTSQDGALHISCMGTAPEFQGRGYGSALMERLAAHSRTLGFEQIVVFTVPPASKPIYRITVDFYEKHGFKLVKEHHDLWQSGAWELRKNLSARRSYPAGRLERKRGRRA